MFQVYFDTNNAAFDPDPADETIRVLKMIIKQIRNSASDPDRYLGDRYITQAVQDANGNRIGYFTLDIPD